MRETFVDGNKYQFLVGSNSLSGEFGYLLKLFRISMEGFMRFRADSPFASFGFLTGINIGVHKIQMGVLGPDAPFWLQFFLHSKNKETKASFKALVNLHVLEFKPTIMLQRKWKITRNFCVEVGMSSFEIFENRIYGQIVGILREGAEMKLRIGTDRNLSKLGIASSFKFKIS
jgi:hypothetical protein